MKHWFKRLLAMLDPEWAKPYMEEEEMKKCLDGVYYLSWYYVIQLALFRLSSDTAAFFKAVLKQNCSGVTKPTCHAFDILIEFDYIHFYSQYDQIIGTIIGALLGSWWLYRQRRLGWKKKISIRSTLNWSFALYSVGVVGTAVWYYYALELGTGGDESSRLDGNWAIIFYLLRGCFGLGWACGIGGAVLWVCESLPPYLRTSGAVMIGSLGFFGAALADFAAAGVYRENSLAIFNGLLMAVTVISFFGCGALWRKLPFDSNLNNIYENRDETKPESWRVRLGKVRLSEVRIVVCVLLIGVTIQYFNFYTRVGSSKISHPSTEDDYKYRPSYSYRPAMGSVWNQWFTPFRVSELTRGDTVHKMSHWDKDANRKWLLEMSYWKTAMRQRALDADTILARQLRAVAALPDSLLDQIVRLKLTTTIDSLKGVIAKTSASIVCLRDNKQYVSPELDSQIVKEQAALRTLRWFAPAHPDPSHPDLKNLVYSARAEADFLFKETRPSDITLSGIRYLGMALAGIWLARGPFFIRKKMFYRKRIPWLLAFLLAQFALLVFMLVLWRFWYAAHINFYGSIALAFCCGAIGCTWIPALLTVAEQFSLRERPLWLLLAPNCYRLADLILLLRTGRVETYSGDNSLAIFLWGLIFAAFAIVAAINLRENFDGDPLHHPSGASLSTPELRAKIREKQEEPLLEYIQSVNMALFENFKSIIKEQVYLNNILYKEKDTWKYADFKWVNVSAYKVYRKGDETAAPIDPHRIANRLLGQGVFESFTQALAEDPQTSAGIIWYSERRYELLEELSNPQKYKVINLADIHVQEMDEYVSALRSFHSERQLDDMVETFKNIESDKNSLETLMQLNLFKGDEIRNRKLLKILAFFRIDAALHFPGRYYIHVVKPYSEKPEIMLLLKTVVPLSEQRLEDLRSLATFIESGKIRKELRDTEWRKVTEEQNHTLRHTLAYLKDKSAEANIPARALAPALNYLSDVNNFNYALLRAGDSRPEIWSDDMKTILRPEPVLLHECISEILEEMLNSLYVIPYALNTHREAVRQFIRHIQSGDTEYLNREQLSYRIHVIKTGWRIVLTDLLKNALKYTDYADPRVHIRFEDMGTHFRLSIVNNQAATEEDLRQFQERSSDQQRLGLRTIDRILLFRYFGAGGQVFETAQMHPSSTDKQLNQTIIYVNIPKLVVSHA